MKPNTRANMLEDPSNLFVERANSLLLKSLQIPRQGVDASTAIRTVSGQNGPPKGHLDTPMADGRSRRAAQELFNLRERKHSSISRGHELQVRYS